MVNNQGKTRVFMVIIQTKKRAEKQKLEAWNKQQRYSQLQKKRGVKSFLHPFMKDEGKI